MTTQNNEWRVEFDKEFSRGNYWSFEDGDVEPLINFIQSLLNQHTAQIVERIVDSKRFFVQVDEDNITIRPVVLTDLTQAIDIIKDN
jgi:hypothetical protein